MERGGGEIKQRAEEREGAIREKSSTTCTLPTLSHNSELREEMLREEERTIGARGEMRGGVLTDTKVCLMIEARGPILLQQNGLNLSKVHCNPKTLCCRND